MNNKDITFKIQKCREQDLEILEKEFPSHSGKSVHEIYFNKQESGQVTYLISWYESKPIETILINWNGCQIPEILQYIINCPTIEIINKTKKTFHEVFETKLIERAEEETKAKQYKQIGTVIEKNDTANKTLYEKLKYKDWGNGTFKYDLIRTVDKTGRRVIETKEATFYIKAIS